LALTAGWRKGILAEDEVVRPINLAEEFVCGAMDHNDGVCYASLDSGKISVEKENTEPPKVPFIQTMEHTFTLWAVASGCKLFWRVFLP